jgi:hypothetical protein
MFQENLKQYVLDNPKLVSMKPAGENIFVLKYRKKVFYDNLWDKFLEHCRGTIVDNDFNIVSYPFQKIYNYGIEKEAPKLDKGTKVTAFRKVNGFMVAMTVHNGELLVSTTGSTDSPYVDMAKEMMATHMPLTDWRMALGTVEAEGVTFMFEACHKNDPHIIPEKEGLHILGYREKSWGSNVGRDPDMLDDLAEMFKCHKAEGFTTTVGELVKLSKTCKHEGFVAYTEDGQAFKIKSPYYLTSKWVARNPRTDKLVDMKNDIKHNIDEEYHNLIDAIRLNIVEYTAMTEQERLEWVRNYMEAV